MTQANILQTFRCQMFSPHPKINVSISMGHCLIFKTSLHIFLLCYFNFVFRILYYKSVYCVYELHELCETDEISSLYVLTLLTDTKYEYLWFSLMWFLNYLEMKTAQKEWHFSTVFISMSHQNFVILWIGVWYFTL